MSRLPSRRETGQRVRFDSRDPSLNRRPSLFPSWISSTGGTPSRRDVPQPATPYIPPPPPKLEPPSITIAKIRYTLINYDRAETEVLLDINNPNSGDCIVSSMKVVLESKGNVLSTTQTSLNLVIRPNLTETARIPLAPLNYKALVSSSPEIKRGQVVPYTLKATPTFRGAFSVHTVHAEKQGELPVPLEPKYQVKKVTVDQASMEECSVRLQLKVDNKNQFDITVIKSEYEVRTSDNKMVKAAVSPNSALIRPQESMVIDFPVSMWPKEIGAAICSVLRGRGSPFRVHWTMEVDTPYGLMHL